MSLKWRRVLNRCAATVFAVYSGSCVWAQFSPGPLSKAHQSLSGPAHCTACHAVAAGGRVFKCLNCHTEIRRRLADRRGLHVRFVKSVRDQQECIRCHSDHNGENFVPIRWDVDLGDFDHAGTGYVLEGRHRGVECRECHTPRHIPAVKRREIVVKDLRRTYLGLSRECGSCHADEHRGQLSADCLSCHTFREWKPASRFDHAEAKFQLAGAHRRLTCEKCHLKVGDTKQYTRYTGLQFSSCSPCHSDPHRGAFLLPCQACHSDDAWKPAQIAKRFDHSRTAFPLQGKHAAVACNECHRTSNFKEPVAHARCMDCHKDEHHGQFLARADGGECGSCHRVGDWRPSTFEAAAHRQTRYPLEGRHAATACGKCHAPAGKETQYRIAFDRCTDCHRDPHRKEFSGEPYKDQCEDCHSVRGFQPSTFSLTRHLQTRFSLVGAHVATPCMECHRSRGGADPPPGRFRIADLSCTGCHQDPHGGAFNSVMLAVRSGGSPRGCEACHNLRRWRDVSTFDHRATSFSLDGTHRAVQCGECHRPLDAALPAKSVRFGPAPARCSGCHEDVHGGQFASAGITDCARCHNSRQWKPSLFDHDADSDFALTGAHRGVACALCHTAHRKINGKLVTVFKPAPKECSGCHVAEIAG